MLPNQNLGSNSVSLDDHEFNIIFACQIFDWVHQRLGISAGDQWSEGPTVIIGQDQSSKTPGSSSKAHFEFARSTISSFANENEIFQLVIIIVVEINSAEITFWHEKTEKEEPM